MIYISKPTTRGGRYVAEKSLRRRLVWWASPTGKADDLTKIEARTVPYKVRKLAASKWYLNKTQGA